MISDAQRSPELEEQLAPILEGRAVYAFQSVGSTMEVAHELAAEGAPEGTLVFASRQEQGRGRWGRAWESPEGGVYLSLIVRPSRPVDQIPQLSLVAGLAMAETILQTTHLFASIRWPNDLLLGGKKVAGILAEGRSPKAEGQNTGLRPPASGLRPAVVIGIGINVSTDPSKLPDVATSLHAAGAVCDPLELTGALCDTFDAWYDGWTKQGFDLIRQALRPWIGLFGHPVQLTAGSEQFQGTAVDLDEQGRLVVRLDSGIQRNFEMGEVTLLR